MSLPDLDDVLPPPRTTDLTALTRAIRHEGELVRSALLAAPLPPLDAVVPEQREQLIRLRYQIEQLIAPLKARLAALDAYAVRAFVTLGATEMPLTGSRTLRFTPPDKTWRVTPAEMRRQLLELVPNKLTRAEVDDAIHEQIEYVVNHTKLNYLARHRGEEVEAIISAHRERVEPPMERGRVSWPDPLED